MAEREPPPTKEQIEAITDVPALEALRDDIADRATRIETDLEFRSDGDLEWERRARDALWFHRVASRHINRHLERMRARAPRPTGALICAGPLSLLTLECLKALPVVEPAALSTTAQVDEALRGLIERIDAVSADRARQIALPAVQRDEAFMSRTGDVLRHLRTQRAALQTRRGEISRALKQAAIAQRDETRERLFVDAAREVLDRASFLAIWDRVDRMQGAAQAEPADA